MTEWLQAHGVPFEASLCPYKTAYPSDRHYLYYSGSEAAGEFRAVATPALRGHRAKGRGTSGEMLFGPLAASARRAGTTLVPQTRAVALVTEGERVVGVECRSRKRPLSPRSTRFCRRRRALNPLTAWRSPRPHGHPSGR